MAAADGPRRVAVLIYPDIALTDMAGPLEAFGLANYIAGRSFYELMTVAASLAPISVGGSFCTVTPTHSFDTLEGPLDTLLIAGGPASKDVSRDEATLAFLRHIEPHCVRVGSICNGTYILCATGVADGRAVATHWHYADDLQATCPQIEVDAEAVYRNSGRIWSSAGMTAGMDMALALIEADLGRALALEVARYLVMPMQRAGGQSQFSMHLKAQFAQTPSIERIQHYIIDHPAADLSVGALANLAKMSTRTFLRQFKAASGKTVGEFVTDARLRHACALLERTDNELKVIAAEAGLGSDANLRKLFTRKLGIGPSLYRERFSSAPDPRPSYRRDVTPSQPKNWLYRSDVVEHGKRTA